MCKGKTMFARRDRIQVTHVEEPINVPGSLQFTLCLCGVHRADDNSLKDTQKAGGADGHCPPHPVEIEK